MNNRINTADIKTTVFHLFLMFLGSGILAFGLYNVHAQSGITEGGVLGMTLLIEHHFGVSPSISGLIIDITCYIIGWKILGRLFLQKALFSSVFFSLFYRLFEKIGYLLPDMTGKPLCAALAGALFIGIGAGLIVRIGGASGGDDVIAMVLSKVMHIRISKAYLFTDVTVLLLSLSYIPFKKIGWSLLTVTLSSVLIDMVKNLNGKKTTV